MYNYNSASGNVLFLILIAVALFAALAYAITSSNRSNGKNVSADEIRLVVNQFEQFKSSVTQAYMRLILNGCTEASINLLSTTTNLTATTTHGTSATAGNECDLFSKNGGGVITPNRTKGTPQSICFNNPKVRFGAPGFYDIYDYGALTSDPDLAFEMPFSSTDQYARAICVEINKRQNMPDPFNATAMYAVTMSQGKLPTDMFCENDRLWFVVHPH